MNPGYPLPAKPSLKICYTSSRQFPDGRVRQPLAENDPANIAYALDGTYYSYYSLARWSDEKLHRELALFDLVFVTLDVEWLTLARRIMAAVPARAVTYSEGHLADYQRLTPAGQMLYLSLLQKARLNFIYWERYLPFYRAISSTPVEYLPYPYLVAEAQALARPPHERMNALVIPTGLAGFTRNGLASLAAARQVLRARHVERIMCWLERDHYAEDQAAVAAFLFDQPYTPPAPRLRHRLYRWLMASKIDYRILLQLKNKLIHARPPSTNMSAEGPLLTYPRLGWMKYLSQLAWGRVLIDLNNRETVGRNALDCAALEIPCVSTDYSDLQARLFPQNTTLKNSWDIEGAAALCGRLLTKPDFYQAVVQQAKSALPLFGITSFRERFARIIQNYAP